MWKPIYAPEPWPQYLKRKDNIGLPLMEVKRKYLAEQLQFDNFQTQQLAVLQGANGGGVNYPKELKGVWGGVDDGELICLGEYTLTRGIKYNGVPIYYNEDVEGVEFVLHAWGGSRWEIGWSVSDPSFTSPEGVKETLRATADEGFQVKSSPTSRNNPRGTYKVLYSTEEERDDYQLFVLNPNDPLPCEIVSL